uniref:Uncharacterized protein n=1 Tax=Arundo donax TaxID=35708 RepID=A0A0A9CA00_ARUDO
MQPPTSLFAARLEAGGTRRRRRAQGSRARQRLAVGAQRGAAVLGSGGRTTTHREDGHGESV